MREATELVIISNWAKKGIPQICHIISKKNPNGQDINPTITFGGYNPFPCYSMYAPYHTVAEWMIKNGWEKLPGGKEIWSGKTFNDAREITGEYTVEKCYIPVKY